MAGGKQTTTQSSSSEPWGAAQPALKTGLNDAQTLYSGGVGSQVYRGSTVVPFAQQTARGMAGMEGFANNLGIGQGGLTSQYADTIRGGGFNPAQQQSMSYLNGIGDNPFDLSKNAAYQTYRGGVMDDVQNRTNAMGSAAGRYGSGAHTANLASELTKAGAGMDLQQMQRMDALNSERFNAGQQGFNNLASAYQNAQTPYQTLMNIGSMNEDLYGRTMNDQLRIFNESQNKPWENLARLNAIASGAGSLGGTSNATASMPGPSPFGQMLGYGLGGLGLLGGF